MIRRFSYLLSTLQARSKDTPKQVVPGPEGMELAIACHALSVPCSGKLAATFKNRMSLGFKDINFLWNF